MKNKIVRYEFIKWMKSKRLWSKYVREYNKPTQYPSEARHIKYSAMQGVRNSPPSISVYKNLERFDYSDDRADWSTYFIFYAFNWCHTEDGHKFWKNIDHEWRDKCDEIRGYNLSNNYNETVNNILSLSETEEGKKALMGKIKK